MTQKVHVVVWEHRHGTDVIGVYSSAKLAQEAIYRTVEDQWFAEMDIDDELPETIDDDDVRIYCESAEESFDIQLHEVDATD